MKPGRQEKELQGKYITFKAFGRSLSISLERYRHKAYHGFILTFIADIRMKTGGGIREREAISKRDTEKYVFLSSTL